MWDQDRYCPRWREKKNLRQVTPEKKKGDKQRERETEREKSSRDLDEPADGKTGVDGRVWKCEWRGQRVKGGRAVCIRCPAV